MGRRPGDQEVPGELGGHLGFPGAPFSPLPSCCDGVLCSAPLLSSRNQWFSLTWMTRLTTGSGPSSTWTPPTFACPPWPPRHPRVRPTRTAWMSMSVGQVGARPAPCTGPQGLSGQAHSGPAACAFQDPHPTCLPPLSPVLSPNWLGPSRVADSPSPLGPCRWVGFFSHNLLRHPKC